MIADKGYGRGGVLVFLAIAVEVEHLRMLLARLVVPTLKWKYQYVLPLLMQTTLGRGSRVARVSRRVLPIKFVPPSTST